MSRKTKSRKRRKDAKGHVSAGPAPPAGDRKEIGSYASLPADQVSQVRRYIAQGDTKSAVKQAKRVHSGSSTADSEALLLEAYEARIDGMRKRGLAIEANSLVGMLETTYASAKARFRATRLRLAAAAGDVETLAGVLNDPQLSPERRLTAEDAIRRELTDLSALARCDALGADHPLRGAARALVEAMEAVTRGPAPDADVALPEVSRRSPLAAWKLLVRAIACFYRHDDAACARFLDAIDGDSVAARLVPAVRAMLDGGNGQALRAPASQLARSVTGDDDRLRRSLRELEAAFTAGDTREIFDAIRQSVRDCAQTRPELLTRLRQHISIRCVLERMPAGKVAKAMDGPSRKDAYFWRLFARAVEMFDHRAEACSLWEEFRRNAVHEGWFPDRSPQTTALYLHMLDLLLPLPREQLAYERREVLDDFIGYGDYYADQPAEVQAAAPDRRDRPDLYFAYPKMLFERICSYETDPDIYARWLKFARGESSGGKMPEDVADRWHRAFPDDSRPLLYLAEAAEERQAFTKALKFIQRAEQLDTLNPHVKRARLRLLTAKAIRHLHQHKPHLLEKDLAEITALPQAREGDRAALVAGLGWLGAVQSGDQAQQQRRRQQVAELLEDPLTADVLLTCLSENHPKAIRGRFDPPNVPRKARLADAVGRCCLLADELHLPIGIPQRWVASLKRELSKNAAGIDAMRLRALGEAALRSDRDELAFGVSRAGLSLGPDHEARFLYLRGRSLPYFCDERRRECLTVAAELARRRREADLVSEIVDELHGRGGFGYFSYYDPEDFLADDEMVDRVLQFEKRSTKWPRSYDRGWGPITPRTAPKRRRGRPALFDHVPDDEDAIPFPYEPDDEPDEEEVLGPTFNGPPPPEVQELIAMVAAETGGRPPTTKDLDRVARKHPEFIEMAARILFADGDGHDLPEGVPSGPFNGPVGSRKGRRKKRKRGRRSRGK